MMIVDMGRKGREAAKRMASAPTEQKNAALNCIADHLLFAAGEILEANEKDVLNGKKAGLSESMVDRLTLNDDRLRDIISDLGGIINLPDPVGEVFDGSVLTNGLQVKKMRVPIGVLGVIYEARPNVTLDVAALTIKTGNVAILRGGSETIRTNLVLVRIIRQALVETRLPIDTIQFVDDPDRAKVNELLQLFEFIDMIIPRGGAALHKFCRENSRIPVITGGIGICHLFVDDSADQGSALEVIQNAKIQRPTVCNALDTVLVHREIAENFIPRLISKLSPHGVSFRGHENAIPYITEDQAVKLAEPDDFDTEWLSLVLGLKVVEGIDEAIAHISQHSTGHSDGILTKDSENAKRFTAEVDSAAVYVNASTRFTDGGQLGLGAEVAISTQRLHARGPMGLRELTTYKWVIEGNYHVRV